MIDRTTWILAAVALLLAAFSWATGGPETAAAGIVEGMKTLIRVVPLLLAAFVIAGLAQVLITQDWVNRWLGSAAGWRGILLGCVGGALLPGGPYVYYPIAAVLLKAGASLGVLVAFVTAKHLWGLARLPLEFALLGPEIALVRVAVTLVMPPMMGVVAETLFGGLIEQMREEARSG